MSFLRPLTGSSVLALLVLLSGCATLPSPPVAATGTAAVPVSQPTPTQPPSVRKQLPEIAGAEEGYGLAMEAFKVGDMETAALLCEAVRERFPGTPWQKRALFLLGRTLLARDLSAEADQVLQRVPAEYPDLADYALFLLAEHRYAKRSVPEAIALYDQLLDHYPASTLAGRASLRKGQALFDSGRYRESAAVFEEALQERPRSDQAPEAALGNGRALAASGDLSAAARAYLDVMVRYPGNGSSSEAEKALAELRSKGVAVPKPTPDELYERGKNLYRQLQYDGAVEAFRGALAADPAHRQQADMLLKSGIALYNLGKRPEAASTFERLVKAKLPDCRCAEALNWLGKSYSRLGMREEALETYRKLVRLYPESDWADDALYLSGNVYRDAKDLKRANTFYRRLVKEYPDSSLADSALWWQGWSQFNAGSYTRSVQTLQELVNRYPRSFLVNQALYWQGLAVERLQGRERAERYYRRILKRGPYTYYGYRAALKLGNGAAVAPSADEPADAGLALEDGEGGPEEELSQEEFDGPPVWTDEAVRTLAAYPAYRKTLELMYLGMKKEAAAELWALQGMAPRRYSALLGLGKAFFELGDYHSSLLLIVRNFERSLERPSARFPEDLWQLAYPQGFWQSIVAASRRTGMDPYYVAAIIREESQFRPEALSPAGARGVMQVMPTTGEWIARTAGIRDFDRAKLYDPDTNIAVGTWYLGHLMKRFKGDVTLVSAAYNAGPEAVAGWVSRNGYGADTDRFVESIPYTETRGYVKKVLRNYSEYQRIYGAKAVAARVEQGALPADGQRGEVR